MFGLPRPRFRNGSLVRVLSGRWQGKGSARERISDDAGVSAEPIFFRGKAAGQKSLSVSRSARASAKPLLPAVSGRIDAQSTINLRRHASQSAGPTSKAPSKIRQSINVLDLARIAHVPPMRTLRQFVTQVRHGDAPECANFGHSGQPRLSRRGSISRFTTVQPASPAR
jgi:hypothetical protein